MRFSVAHFEFTTEHSIIAAIPNSFSLSADDALLDVRLLVNGLAVKGTILHVRFESRSRHQCFIYLPSVFGRELCNMFQYSSDVD